MATKHTISHADEIFIGNAAEPAYNDSNRTQRGIKMSHPFYVSLGTPALADADGVSASASVTGGANAVIGGALASGGAVTMDATYGRNVVAAWTNTAVVTVYGTDWLGRSIVESSASGTSFTGNKAFKTVTRVVFSADVTSATVGSGAKLGIPFRISSKNQIAVRMDGAADAATVVAAVDTSPATATTGDVRGTITTNTALNGSKEVSVFYFDLDHTSKEGAFGVAQYAG